jgi:hypothetical protein
MCDHSSLKAIDLNCAFGIGANIMTPSGIFGGAAPGSNQYDAFSFLEKEQGGLALPPGFTTDSIEDQDRMPHKVITAFPF